MAEATSATSAVSKRSQDFLDTNQYSRNGILRYEQIFGETYVSTGGKATTARFAKDLGLKEGARVLDVCCGIGGSAFYLARTYGAHVTGVDLSSNMVGIARENRDKMEPGVKFRTQVTKFRPFLRMNFLTLKQTCSFTSRTRPSWTTRLTFSTWSTAATASCTSPTRRVCSRSFSTASSQVILTNIKASIGHK